MRKHSLAVLGAVALGACSSGNSAIDEADTTDQTGMMAGQWMMSGRVTAVHMPDLTEAQNDAFLNSAREEFDADLTIGSQCINEEQARQPTLMQLLPPEDVENCTYSQNRFENGEIAMTMECFSPNGSAGDIAINGSYSDTALTATVEINARDNDSMEFAYSAEITGEHTGDCEG